MANNTNGKPVAEIRVGRITATIWQNTPTNEGVFYSVHITRLFRRGGTAPRRGLLSAGERRPAARWRIVCRTGRSPPRRRCLSGPGWPTPWRPAREEMPARGRQAPSATALASSRVHSRNARTSARCRAAAVVMRQQRSGASAWRSKTGTSVLLSSSRAISMGRPMAAPIPCIAASTSML